MTTLTDFKALLDPSLIQPHRRELWDLLYLLLADHDGEITALQAFAAPIPVSASTVTTAAECDAAYLAATGVAAVVGDVMVAVVSAAQNLLVKTAAAAWDYVVFGGELTT